MTSQGTGAGYLTGSLAPGATQEIRLEATPDYTDAPGTTRRFALTATSTGSAAAQDVAAASATVTAGYRPDISAKASVPMPCSYIVLSETYPVMGLV